MFETSGGMHFKHRKAMSLHLLLTDHHAEIMKTTVLAIAGVILGSTAASALTIESLAERLRGVECYSDSCVYEVYLPTHYDPVAYSVNLRASSDGERTDSLAPCDYVIDWSLPTPSGLSEGFSAYFDGTHLRFRDKRLQEYHAGWDMAPFAPRGYASGGVQYQNQFADLLPHFLADKLCKMATDSGYHAVLHPDTIVGGRRAIVVDGQQRYRGYTSQIYSLAFDYGTSLPFALEYVSNPDQISEQSISVRYFSPSLSSGRPCAISLESLIATHSEAFEKYRESSFSLETLPGRPLPEISAPTPTGERYFRRSGDPFAAPTVLVFLDTSVATTPQVVREVREAVSQLPMQTDVVWAFIDKRSDDIEAVVPRPETGEFLLMNATGAARDCGVGSVTPVLIFCSPDGTVREIINGYNKDLPALVIQKAILSNN